MGRYHFIGIGGIGMSSLASILLERDHEVSGSDLNLNERALFLKTRGAKVFEGHHKENVPLDAVIVHHSRILKNNPEFLDENPKIHRLDLLTQTIQNRPIYAVVGAHGKTSTSSLLSYVAHQLDNSYGFSVGGVLENFCLNGKDGTKGFVIEGDESDGSFLRIFPKGSIITNIDPDHLDFWNDFSCLKKAYQEYIETIEDKNLLFYAKDEVCDLVQTGTSYGIHKGDIQAVDIVLNPKGSFYTITIPKKNLRINNVFLPLIGEHQIKNSLAVFGLALELGFDPYRIVEQFANYRGVKRRCERVLNQNKALVFLDYGHHPLELEATFNGLKHQFQRPLVVIFEPHKYTRTKSFFLEFVQVLKGCDTLFLLKTYPAGEVFDFDGSSEKLAQQLNLDLLDELDLSLAIEKYKDKPVTILFIGAGKIDLFCKECFS